MKITKETVVAITGASRGIGRAAAIEFARRGAKVVLLSRDLKRMEEAANRVKEAGGETLALACDVSDEKASRLWVPRAIERFGRIDILVNNAGFGHYAGIETIKTEDLDRIFRTNLYGAIWCTQAVLPQMKKQARGHIVNVSTIISRRSIPFMSAYCMTKFAMNAMDEALRLEVKNFGIRVSLVCPGLTATDFQTNAGRDNMKPLMPNDKGMTAEKVGRAILRSVECNRRLVALTAAGKALWFVDKFFPQLVDQAIYRMYARRASVT